MSMTTWWIIIAIVAVGLVIWYLLSSGKKGQGPAKGPGSKPGEGPSSGPGQGPSSGPGQGPLGSDQGPSGDKPPKGPSSGPSE